MRKFTLFATLLTFSAPLFASAHEVYVLTPGQVQAGLQTPPFSMIDTMLADMHQFMFWAFIGILTVATVFLISISRRFENLLDPLLSRLRPYAPVVSRVTIGLSFLAAALFQASYGPELPLAATWGTFSPLITLVLVVIGLCITFGFLTRLAAFVALGLFIVSVYFHGWYMLTYMNYLGEIFVLFILGAHKLGVHTKKPAKRFFSTVERHLAPYAFFILRIAFGVSLLYASLYAKWFHNNLALDVASLPLAHHMFGLAYYLHFEPHFLVLGAGIIEIIIAIFFILGIEIRFTALFLEFWLTLSLVYFGEVVWPHLILIGIPIAFIFYGYDKYSLEGRLFKKGSLEPIL